MGKKLILRSGVVGDHDGAYDWVRDFNQYDPEWTVGYHKGQWPGEDYTVVETKDDDDRARDEWLQCLVEAGVDNWPGIDYAHTLLQERTGGNGDS